ncbi:MAG: type II toxin-antitoxin system VapC family toxin [Gaiellales bacterium]
MIAYLDASALVKLLRAEPESDALRTFVRGCDTVSSEIVATEVLRTATREAAGSGSDLGELIEGAMVVMEEVVLIMARTATLVRAGLLEGMHLRALDAIHIATATSLGDVDLFVTYDERQAASAQLAGLTTISPGA